jgi:pimeloyl-ACP methyl ester carboxylesterase
LEVSVKRLLLVVSLLALVCLAAAAAAGASPAVGTSFPAGFVVPTDASLGTPVIGFGAAGAVERTPVIFLHGNNDTPFATPCNPYGNVHDMAQYFADHGYRASELWGLGYQGGQCDLVTSPTNRSGEAHSTLANVPDLRAFVRSVLRYTGAKRVDIAGHSLGVTLAREWMRQDNAYHLVRHLVAIDGPNHGIVDCAPLISGNYFALPALGGFTPDSAICREYGSDHTPFLTTLNRHETKGPTKYLVIRNADTSFVYFSAQDGIFAPLPAVDKDGNPHDFSLSATLRGADELDLTGQGSHDPFLGTAHLGIANSPDTWAAALAFLTQGDDEGDSD